MKNITFILSICMILFFTSYQFAEEILIYADKIDYDSKENLVAKGKVKLIKDKEIITSELIIINEKEEKIILPKEFRYKDEGDNYYYGTSGEFSSTLDSGNIKNIKMLLNDGSRIVGSEAFKEGKIDLINKGVYSPCKSKINIKNFICPIWQIDGEKILHDRDKLFLHHKHAKMRVFNIPIYYFPYIVSPSPLRKERKSGFLNPTISFNFIDVQSSQSTSFPYYFALDIDKELLLTPTINYGGGVDASQRIVFNYDQLISGGNLSIDLSTDTNLENQNNESWLRDASLVVGLNQNINEHFNYKIASALQSSPTYIRRTDQNNPLNRKNVLTSSFDLNGFDLNDEGDRLNVNVTGYQVVKNLEDNKTTPTTFPYVSYSFGQKEFSEKTNYNNHLTFYNIFRDIATDDHAQKQQKLHHSVKTDTLFYSLNSKINFKTELHSHFYNIENKKISGNNYTGTYERVFPMTGIYFETPLIDRTSNLNITPKASFIVNGSQSSSDKVSNEESTNNSYSLFNNSSLNRYTGTDKLDNSKRVNYGIETSKSIFNGKLKNEISQSYEFDANSNFNKEVGLKDYMSDLLGSSSYEGPKNTLNHTFRLNVDQGKLESQTLGYGNKNFLGTTSLTYTEETSETNSIITTNRQTLDFSYASNVFFKYSEIGISTTFDLIKDDPTAYKFGYKYFDECFGVNFDFGRSFYEDRDLKPKDILTLMFSFKNLGSYKSTNLAVSETDKQNIRWESGGVEETSFK